MDSGEVEVLSVVACHDVGRAVNPANVTGQIEGAVSMGLGFRLMEEVLLEEAGSGIPVSASIYPHVSGYAGDRFASGGSAGGLGSFWGERGGGAGPDSDGACHLECHCCCCGIRVKDLPATPEALWRLLHSPGI